MNKSIFILFLIVFLVACQGEIQSSAPQDTLSLAETPKIIQLQDGETFELRAQVVEHQTAGTLYAYNGQIPGPTLKVKQGTSITVLFTNSLDQETTVHWHGLRHDNRDDGVPGVTQDPVQPGETYEYTLQFPDEGIYWYHPHVREDMQQDRGLYGNILVVSEQEHLDVAQEEFMVLDDISIGVPHNLEYATHALMGRFGDTVLVNGASEYSLNIEEGRLLRLYVTNVANVRPFNLSIPGADIQLVGGDLGRYAQEQNVESVILAPAERAIIEVSFKEEGVYDLIMINPHAKYTLGKIAVDEPSINNILRVHDDVREDISSFEPYFEKPPDHEVLLTLETNMHMGEMPCHQMPDGSWMGDCGDEHITPIEWEDEMGQMNAMATDRMVTWILEDRDSGKQNMDFMMKHNVGDKVKIRLINTEDSMHPMQHPIHLHGQRFLITHVDGVPVENKVWKDTVLVPAGSEVDILVDVTNPGEWMLHCHIAEHLTAGMMSSFVVE